ncbi:hypothetical protein LB558_16205 [Mesorhizobium sp. CO1-1-8]|nr:hypothetical protein [Mesorhizobium sp. CO1-1-8]
MEATDAAVKSAGVELISYNGGRVRLRSDGHRASTS